jgi:aspartate oxidase
MMYDQVGIVREERGLYKALDYINSVLEPFEKAGSSMWTVNAANIRNQFIVSKLMVEAALSRKESRGTHFRSDFPKTDTALDHTHTISQRGLR